MQTYQIADLKSDKDMTTGTAKHTVLFAAKQRFCYISGFPLCTATDSSRIAQCMNVPLGLHLAAGAGLDMRVWSVRWGCPRSVPGLRS